MGRKLSISAVIACCAIWADTARVAADVTITSPGGTVEAVVSIDGDDRLQYRVNHGGLTVLENGQLGITVDGVDLGSDVASLAGSAPVEIHTTYPYRGAKSVATDHYSEVTVTASRVGAVDDSLTMVWRAYDDGVAFRYRIPGSGSRTIGGENSSWHLPAGTTAWTQFNTSYYEGEYKQISLPHWAVVTTPLTCRLPGGGAAADGYVTIMEAALYDYSGMVLYPVVDGRTFRTHFIDDTSWSMTGGSWTPWRVALISPTLDGLVNSTLAANLNPPPSSALDNASWIRPGRALWSWWARRDGNYDARFQDQQFYIDAAENLGFQYVLWDEGWDYWDDQGHDFDALLAYARDHGIGVWLWRRWTGVQTAAQRADFFGWINAKNAALGEKVIVGVKLDFMDSESKSLIDWYEATLTDAADHELMVNFHGANKPTGGSRRFPNEMTREGVRGLEYHIWDNYLPPSHNAALPFTRLLGGHADYTPVTLWDQKLGTTSYAHQLAMALLLISPVTHWADDPVRYLNSSAREVIEAAPTVWDETVVLDGSAIGELAALARRKDERWFVAIINGDADAARTVPVDLSFLSPRPYEAVLLADDEATAAAFDRSEQAVDHDDVLSVWLRPGGGFVAMLTPAGVPGDFDGDGDVDQSDFGRFQACMSGPFAEQHDPQCAEALMDDDNDVDALDHAMFTGCMSGADVPGDLYCLE
ncbi:MAG: hypothetical protein GF393_12990 [Armatimonadia bacterium]|nr:hypothetical protein [Armatimonadia bacterium]